jgi:dolichol-phosphate mannosyltransferase
MALAGVPPVTVIVPCLDEESGIPYLLERLRAMHERPETSAWHFLFIDDGSGDQTLSLLLRAERDFPCFTVVRLHETLGLGAALRTGFALCRSPIVCTLDSDATYPPERLPELVRLIEQGYDVATASVWHPENSEVQGSRLRLFFSWSVSRIYKLLVGQDVYTFTCLFRAYRLEVVRRIQFRVDGFASVAEIMVRAMKERYRIAELPMPIEPRRYGKSKLRLADAITAHLVLLTITAAMAGARRLTRQG